MTNAPLGYLDAALRRMALPIRIVNYKRQLGSWELRAPCPLGLSSTWRYADSPAEATAAYLSLCCELDPTAS